MMTEEAPLNGWAQIEEVTGMSRKTILRRIADGDDALSRAIRRKRAGTVLRNHVIAFRSELISALRESEGGET